MTPELLRFPFIGINLISIDTLYSTEMTEKFETVCTKPMDFENLLTCGLWGG